MHATLHIITDHKIETEEVVYCQNTFRCMPELDEIMDPYYENDFYEQYYDPETDDLRDIPREDYPEFLWDYYNLRWSRMVDDINKQDRTAVVNGFDWPLYRIWVRKDPEKLDARHVVGICYALIDKDRTAVVKDRWNGNEHVDQRDKFRRMAWHIVHNLKPTDWITEIDYHH